MLNSGLHRLAATAALAVALAGCALTSRRPPASAELSADLADFRARVDAYAALSERLASQARLPDRATPEQIAVRQHELADGIRGERAAARQGDLFTPAATERICAMVRQVLAGPLGASHRESIEEENPRRAEIQANEPYPDGLALSTVPAYLLNELPPLPDELEYRFVGNHLILHDVLADLVVDYAPDCLRTPAQLPAKRRAP